MVLRHCGQINQRNRLEGSAHVSGRNECVTKVAIWLTMETLIYYYSFQCGAPGISDYASEVSQSPTPHHNNVQLDPRKLVWLGVRSHLPQQQGNTYRKIPIVVVGTFLWQEIIRKIKGPIRRGKCVAGAGSWLLIASEKSPWESKQFL